MKLYQQIASCLTAIENCRKTGNTEWQQRHAETIESLVKNHMPSGSGVDSGVAFDYQGSKPNKLLFQTAFHHMSDEGMYDGWTEHGVVVTPDLALGFGLRITGRDRNDIKDYLGELFHEALNAEISEADYRAACGVKENAA